VVAARCGMRAGAQVGGGGRPVDRAGTAADWG
jgi:hypothetical protein